MKKQAYSLFTGAGFSHWFLADNFGAALLTATAFVSACRRDYWKLQDSDGRVKYSGFPEDFERVNKGE